LATKGISVDAGVIDTDYKGEIKVLLVNHNKVNYEVKKGDWMAQLIVEQLDDKDWMEVQGLDVTERAGKGFGSSGLGTELKEIHPTIFFLQADGNHQFYDPFGIVTTLQIGSYSGLDSSPYGIPSGNHIEDRPVYLVYYR